MRKRNIKKQTLYTITTANGRKIGTAFGTSASEARKRFNKRFKVKK